MFDRILNSPLQPLIIFAKVLAICLLNLIKIFHHISSITVFRHVTRGEGGRSLLPFFRTLKKCFEFRKKCPNYIHLWVKFLFQNVVLSVFRKFFPVGLFFRVLQIKCFRRVSRAWEVPPAPFRKLESALIRGKNAPIKAIYG